MSLRGPPSLHFLHHCSRERLVGVLRLGIAMLKTSQEILSKVWLHEEEMSAEAKEVVNCGDFCNICFEEICATLKM